MKRLILAVLFMAIAVTAFPVLSQSGACDCDCLLDAIRDPDTDPDDLPNLIKAYQDYDC